MSVASLQPSAQATEKPAIDLELVTPAFSGPLALLLELIERRRLPITEVSLAEVADQYLERMRTMAGLDPELLADFLVIAAKLLVIKSRELLPSPAPIHSWLPSSRSCPSSSWPTASAWPAATTPTSPGTSVRHSP